MKQHICLQGISREVEGLVWDGHDRLRIGRQPPCEMLLKDSSVSRSHAELASVDSQVWVVRDLGSTNGTYLNGVRVSLEEREVKTRDLLQIGNVVLRIATMDQSEADTLESICGTMHVEATARQSWEEAFEVVARHATEHPQTGAQLLGLLRVGHDLQRNNSMDEWLQTSLDDAVRALGARRGALVLADENTGKLSLQTASTCPADTGPAPRYSRTLARRCLASGESLLSSDIHDEFWRSESFQQENMGSVLCALLRSPRRRLGVLHFDRGPAKKGFTVADLRLADAIAASIAGSIESAQFMLAKQRSWFVQTVITLAQTIELRDPYTAGHADRVTKYALLLADQLGVTAEARQQIGIGGPLHDIGKIGIRDAVLRKNGRLTHKEDEHMRSHTVKGAAILGTIPDLVPIIPIVRNHHERWDGFGYPDRLTATEIPFVARIVAVADAFDAMTSNRPYRAGLSLDQAFEEVRTGAGTQFDPECSEAFLALADQLANLVQTDQAAKDTEFDLNVECPASSSRAGDRFLQSLAAEACLA